MVVNSPTDMYIDSVYLAYAPYTYVYRNGSLIHEGYTVEYTDTAKLDTAVPNSPTVNTPQYNTSNGNVTLTWGAVSDNGTTHTYTLKSKDSTGSISALSAQKQVKVTSGIKGYRVYYNGTYRDVTATTITLTPSEYKNVRVVAIDKAGNESSNTFTSPLPSLPTVTATQSTTNWVQSNSINYSFSNHSFLTLKQVNSTDLSALTGTYPVAKNGNYVFKAKDAYGQLSAQANVNITNIDTVTPNITGSIA